MLTELDMPIAYARAEFAVLQDHFIAALDPLVNLLFAAERRGSGEQAFALPALLVRAINDVVVAFHLLCHGYLNQAYGAMRMAYEACDLLELVGKDPAEAALWVNSDRPWRDFAPSRVRDRLGKDEHDEIYSQLSAYSHPRFEGANLMGFVTRPVGGSDDRSTHILRLGPFLIDDHPAIGFAAGFLGSTLGLVGLRTSYLALTGAVSEEMWEECLRRSMAAQQKYMVAVSTMLASRGVTEAGGIATSYEAWRAVLDAEAEALPEERRPDRA